LAGNMLGLRWRKLSKLVQQDIERVTGLPFPRCLMSDLDRVIRAMEEAPGAFGPALVLLRGLRPIHTSSPDAAIGPARAVPGSEAADADPGPSQTA
jgi:hypothetical protein